MVGRLLICRGCGEQGHGENPPAWSAACLAINVPHSTPLPIPPL